MAIIPEQDVKHLNTKNIKVTTNDANFGALAFCRQYSLTDRKKMSERIHVLHPDHMGLVLHLADSATKELRQHMIDPSKPWLRMYVTSETPMSEVVMRARGMFSKELPPVAGIFLYVCDGSVEKLVNLQARMGEYRTKAIKDDGLAHMLITVEAVFGDCSE